jgi:hypothetical protein
MGMSVYTCICVLLTNYKSGVEGVLLPAPVWGVPRKYFFFASAGGE